MTPVIKILLSGTLVVLVCAAVIIPTVIVVTQKKDNGNTTTTTMTSATAPASTSQTGSSSTTGPYGTTSGGSTTYGGSTTSGASTTSGGSTTVRVNTTAASTTRTTASTTVNSSLFSATYSSSLTRQSQMLCTSTGCATYTYYQAVLINTTVTGSYRIYSQSNMDTLGYLYNQSFDTRYLGLNLIATDDDGYGGNQFLITAQLPAGGRYIAVLTTYVSNTTGAFALVVTGAGPIVLTPINTTDSVVMQQTNVSTSLTNSSSKFCRQISCAAPSYYYQAYVFNVSITASYAISSSSSIDTYGFLFSPTFEPANVTINQVTSNDDGASNGQFLVSATLFAGMRYVLVATTYNVNVFGSMVIFFAGQGIVSFIS